MGALLTGFALNATGYIPNAVQTASTQNGIRFVMIGVPIVFVALSFMIYKTKFKLHGAYYDKIMNVLALRKRNWTSVWQTIHNNYRKDGGIYMSIIFHERSKTFHLYNDRSVIFLKS